MTFAGTAESIRAGIVVRSGVGKVLERHITTAIAKLRQPSVALDVRNGATVVLGQQVAGAGVGQAEHGGGPHVERGQVQVEVEHFARVATLEEADLDGLAHVGGVDHGDQGVQVVVDGVVRIDQYLTQAIWVQVDGIRDAREAGHAGDAGEDRVGQGILSHGKLLVDHRAFFLLAPATPCPRVETLGANGTGNSTGDTTATTTALQQDFVERITERLLPAGNTSFRRSAASARGRSRTGRRSRWRRTCGS